MDQKGLFFLDLFTYCILEEPLKAALYQENIVHRKFQMMREISNFLLVLIRSPVEIQSRRGNLSQVNASKQLQKMKWFRLVFTSSVEGDFIFPLYYTLISSLWRESSLYCRQIWIDLNIIWKKIMPALKNRRYCHPHAHSDEGFLCDETGLKEKGNSLWISLHIWIARRGMRNLGVWPSLPSCLLGVSLEWSPGTWHLKCSSSGSDVNLGWGHPIPSNKACGWTLGQIWRDWGWMKRQAKRQRLVVIWRPLKCTVKSSGQLEWWILSVWTFSVVYTDSDRGLSNFKERNDEKHFLKCKNWSTYFSNGQFSDWVWGDLLTSAEFSVWWDHLKCAVFWFHGHDSGKYVKPVEAVEGKRQKRSFFSSLVF